MSNLWLALAALSALLQGQLTRRENAQTGPKLLAKLQRLDKVLDMSKAGAISNTIAFSEGVDLESINKGKCVNDGYQDMYFNFESDVTTLELRRASRVDGKKLEKQEAKLKAKIKKRARRDRTKVQSY